MKIRKILYACLTLSLTITACNESDDKVLIDAQQPVAAESKLMPPSVEPVAQEDVEINYYGLFSYPFRSR